MKKSLVTLFVMSSLCILNPAYADDVSDIEHILESMSIRTLISPPNRGIISPLLIA